MKFGLHNIKYMNVFFDDGESDASEESSFNIKLRTRDENLIAKIASNASAKTISPKTRDEYFLSMIAGDTTAGTIEPKTKNEYLLNMFVNGSSDGGDGGDSQK